MQAAAEADDPQSSPRAPTAVAGELIAARHSAEQERLIRVARRLGERVARARGEQPIHAGPRAEAPAALRGRITRLRGDLGDARRERTTPPQPACEPGAAPGPSHGR